MAGHSKWANIQHRKGRQDARRSRLFSRLTREVAVAARMGGPEPADNSRLRQAVVAAVAANLPRDTIERAIQRSIRRSDADQLEELCYEGYAAGGVAVLVDCITDNRNRTVAEVRNAFRRYDGSLGRSGAVSHLFKRRGRIRSPATAGLERVFELAVDQGAEEVTAADDGSIEILTAPTALETVRQALEAAGCEPWGATLYMHPLCEVEPAAEAAGKVLKLLELLDGLEDVQALHSNAIFPDGLTA